MAHVNKQKYKEIANRMREIPQELQDSSHEWEELVHNLCASQDTALHDIGVRELEIIQQNSLQRTR